MGLRPAHCYRSLKDRAYTRAAVKVPRRNYIGATPAMRVRQFNTGNGRRVFSHIVEIISTQDRLVRDNAIEASRILIVKHLTDKFKKEGFFLKVRIYPHHILRENKQAQGAGADRVTTGMAHAFGKPIGRAARVKAGKALFSVLIDEENVDKVVAVMKTMNSKLPCKTRVKIGTDVESIGTKPKKLREAVLAEMKKKEDEKEVKEGDKKEAGKEGEAKKEESKDGKKDSKKDGKDSGKKDDKKDAKKGKK